MSISTHRNTHTEINFKNFIVNMVKKKQFIFLNLSYIKVRCTDNKKVIYKRNIYIARIPTYNKVTDKRNGKFCFLRFNTNYKGLFIIYYRILQNIANALL